MTATEVVHPARQADVEAWLDRLGVTWRFNPDLRLAKVDQHAGLANQVRHQAIHEEVVERYTAAMNDGAVFPPIIVTDTDPAVPLGGNHRIAAGLGSRCSTMPAYMVTGNDQQLRRIRFEDNARHGLAPTPAERVEHAVALMADGMSQRDAAAIVGIPQPKLSIAAAALRATQRATDAGVDGFNRLPEMVRYELSRLEHPAVFQAAAELALATAMPVGTLRPVIAATVDLEPTEALRIIGAEHEDHRTRSTQRGGNVRATSRTDRARLDLALATIFELTPIEVFDTCPNDDVRAVLAERIRRVSTPLHQIHDLLVDGPPEGR